MVIRFPCIHSILCLRECLQLNDNFGLSPQASKQAHTHARTRATIDPKFISNLTAVVCVCVRVRLVVAAAAAP